jgi:hypothetical protein
MWGCPGRTGIREGISFTLKAKREEKFRVKLFALPPMLLKSQRERP